MLSKSWKQELVARSLALEKIFAALNIEHCLVGIGGNGIQISVGSISELGTVLRQLFVTWPDVIGVQITRTSDSTRSIHIIFEANDWDLDAPSWEDEDGSEGREHVDAP